MEVFALQGVDIVAADFGIACRAEAQKHRVNFYPSPCAHRDPARQGTSLEAQAS